MTAKIKHTRMVTLLAEAEDRIMHAVGAPDDRDLAFVQLWNACNYYEGAVGWDVSCVGCGKLLSQLHAQERRCAEAEAALLVMRAERFQRTGRDGPPAIQQALDAVEPLLPAETCAKCGASVGGMTTWTDGRRTLCAICYEPPAEGG